MQTQQSVTKGKTSVRRDSRVSWVHLCENFPDPLECLASFIALEAAEVLDGIKPANLVQLRNRRQPCGRNLLQLWEHHSADLLALSPLKALVLNRKSGGNLMLFYDPKLLENHLRTPEIIRFLAKCGYQDPCNLPKSLHELRRRFHRSTEMPHEIGLFLGYPLKDVAGFMGTGNQPCTDCRMWRIYGDPAPSIALSERFAACRRRMAERLRRSFSPRRLLKAA